MGSIVNRRQSLGHLLAAGASAGLAGGLAGASAAQAAPSGAREQLARDIKDPLKAFQTRIKIMGSLEDTTIHAFMRLNVYADPENGNYVPLFSMNNLLIDRWEKLSDEHFRMTKFEAGTYTVFDSEEPLEEMVNPFTGETIEVFPFRLGPVVREYMPNEIIAPGFVATPLPLQIIGDRIFHSNQVMEVGREVFTPEEYPIETPGPVSFINSLMTWSALVDDVANPDLPTAAGHMQLQNKVPWAPWLRMRGRPGGTVVRGFGTRISGLEALPDHVIAAYQKHTPQILQPGQWDDLVFETFDYLEHMEAKKAASGS